MELLLSLCLGIALSACAGFRVFVPLLVANLATKFGFIHLAQGFEFMNTTTATLILAAATFAEIFAYYIPFVDNLLDTIALPTSFIAGTLLTTSFLKIDDPTLHWGLGLLAGGGVAGTIQAGTSLLRLGSSKFTGGMGNLFFATFENFIAISLSILTIWLPIFVAAISCLLFIWIIRKFVNRFSKRENAEI
jgi:Domain of unknown function (DUF4126)